MLALIEGIGELVPECASDLQRALAALQSALRHDAVLPSHGAAVSCAALRALAQLSSRFPDATIEVQSQLQAWAQHNGLPAQARSAAAVAHLDLVATDNDLDALVTAMLLLFDSVPDPCALLSATCAAASGIIRRNQTAIARSRAVSASAKHPTHAKLVSIAAVHAHIGAHSQPQLRHQAFRLLRILAGAEPTVLEAVEGTELELADKAAAPERKRAARC